MDRRTQRRIHPAWWTAALIVVVVGFMVGCWAKYAGWYISYVPVTVKSERAGLIMEPGGKVMMQGVQVGRVAQVSGSNGAATLAVEMFPDQIQYVPANVGAQIRATTIFGAKYVDLIYPDQPSPQRLRAGAVLESRNVTTEVNTVFENLTDVLHQIDPAKLNAMLAALAEGFGGQGERMGQAITDANQVLMAINPRSETVRRDWRSLKGFSDTYAAAAPDMVSTLDALSTTSATITSHATALDALLLNTVGVSQAGINLLAPNQKNLIDAVNLLQPTTSLVMKYNPVLTCTLLGAKYWLDDMGGEAAVGGNGKSFVADSAVLLGDDMYEYPTNLPITAAKGGPGGKPSCGSLPEADKMFPVRQLITNTGWGTGIDVRPNPGIGHPCYADYLPVTRAVPQPPSIRMCLPGPAPGPVNYPGAPPYGAPLYGPGGVPLWPGIPPAGTPPPVPVPGTPVAPGKIAPQPPPPAVFSAPPPPIIGGAPPADSPVPPTETPSP
jgi:phospholipid/cholesterol/gamma-HCH transport system substrate-binding protein